ncbi:DUF817 domain-containing protein [Bacillus spongiae]|uniref:DUF817 domain-containing protein n=1 Tax=Bacillus spongiae TaxID=2683610 RepID=A0ABU8HB40_9BACI
MKHFQNFLYFGFEQAKSCLFPIIIFLSLALTKMIEIPFIARYDLILLICLMAQIMMILFKYETMDEVKVIIVFHLIGLALELFKVQMSSWSYPEEAISKIYGVPLYSGFMYASVASYMCQAWRRLDLRLNRWPSSWVTIMLGSSIYFNFYTHHYIMDLRWILKITILLVFIKTYVSFTVNKTSYKMPLIVSFILIGFFIWIAENIATFYGAWTYPNQEQTWQIVHLGKISSWLLLVIVSFMIVAELKHVKSTKEFISKRRKTTILEKVGITSPLKW